MNKERNYVWFYTLLKSMPGADKEGLVLQYTNGRTSSLRETTDKEYYAMCEGMQKQVNGVKTRDMVREELRRKRSAALHQLQKMGIDTTDWNRVNAYCSEPRIAGKEFRKLTTEELDLLVIKLRMIQRKENNKSDKSLLN